MNMSNNCLVAIPFGGFSRQTLTSQLSCLLSLAFLTQEMHYGAKGQTVAGQHKEWFLLDYVDTHSRCPIYKHNEYSWIFSITMFHSSNLLSLSNNSHPQQFLEGMGPQFK